MQDLRFKWNTQRAGHPLLFQYHWENFVPRKIAVSVKTSGCRQSSILGFGASPSQHFRGAQQPFIGIDVPGVPGPRFRNGRNAWPENHSMFGFCSKIVLTSFFFSIVRCLLSVWRDTKDHRLVPKQKCRTTSGIIIY